MTTDNKSLFEEFFDIITSENNSIRELIKYIHLALTFFSLPIIIGYLLYQLMSILKENVFIIILLIFISVFSQSLGLIIKNFNNGWKYLCIIIRAIKPYWNIFFILALIEPIFGMILSIFINLGVPIIFCGGPMSCFNMVIDIFGNLDTFINYYILGFVVLTLSDSKI